jgi:AmmeMemoRadiSam system protein B
MTANARVRRPAVAGRFYPADAATLRATIAGDLAGAPHWDRPVPKAFVLPHAGYMFSGPIAASGYAALAPARDTVERVVLLGPAHFVGVHGLALSSADAFATPLGSVPVDIELRDRVVRLPAVSVSDAAHAPEHSLEVHLPFLQEVLGEFKVLPIVVGRADPESVADVLDAVWGGPETVIVVSTDLSHYLGYDAAAARDRSTADAIVDGAVDAIAPDDACGAYPVSGLLAVAARRGLRGELLDLRNSGDTAGPRDRVVGYGAFVFTEPNPLFGR